MRIGIAADHGGLELKEKLASRLRGSGHEVADFGADKLTPEDDCLDFVTPKARAISAEKVDRGVTICGSDTGA